MPHPTRNGLNIFKTRENGIKYTKKDGSFYVKNVNDGKLRLYTRKNKTGAIKMKTLTPSASSSSSRYDTAKSKSSSSMKFYSAKSKSKSKSSSASKTSSNSSTHFRKNKTPIKSKSLRLGVLNRQLCGKNRRTNRCRFIRGSEKTSTTCHLSNRNICVKVPKFDRTKCGHSRKTKRCRFLRRGRKVNKKCELTKKRCLKIKK